MKFNIPKILQITFTLINIFLITIYSNAAKYQYKQILKIYSSSQITNILANTITFQGKVTLEYQNINVRADKIIIHYNTSIIKAYGNPVNLYQNQKLNDIISAQSLVMHYDINNHIVNLIGNAYIKRAGNSIHSDNITYTIKDKQITAVADQGHQVITTFLIQN